MDNTHNAHITQKHIASVAEAWASIEGNMEVFQLGRTTKNRIYSTYMNDAKELLRRLEAKGFMVGENAAMLTQQPPLKTAKLSHSQYKTLCEVSRRDWPNGEPRISWLHATSAKILLERGLINERPDPGSGSVPFVDLTPAGEAVLATM